MKTWVINCNKHYKNYCTIKLIDNLYFHYTEDLDFETGKSSNGNIFVILGNITHCNEVYKDPSSVLTDCNLQDFLMQKKYWGGKWAVFYEFKLYTDFTSLYSILWHSKERLLSNTFEVFHNNNLDQIEYKITNSYYLNWFVTPKTAFKNINKVMPGTGLDLSKGKIEILTLEYAKVYNKTENEISELLSRSLKYEAESIIANYSKTWIALSAGYDSRLIYSIFSNINPSINSFTHIFPQMNIADSKIPNRINKNNLKVYPKKLNKNKVKDYDSRVNDMVLDSDRNFYGRGQWDFLKKNEVVVRGGVLELAGISSAHLEGKYDDFGTNLSDSKLFLYSLKDFRQFQHDSFRSYIKHYLARNSNLRWSKQLYIDQRLAGWLSYVELGLDFLEGNSIHLGNSEYTINLMLSLPLKNMKVKGFHIDEIKSNNENLLKIPFNKNNLSAKIVRIIALTINKVIGDKLTTTLFY